MIYTEPELDMEMDVYEDMIVLCRCRISDMFCRRSPRATSCKTSAHLAPRHNKEYLCLTAGTRALYHRVYTHF